MEGFCVRHWFHDRGPRRNASTCLDSEDNATHALNYKRYSHKTRNRQTIQNTTATTLMQAQHWRQADSNGDVDSLRALWLSRNEASASRARCSIYQTKKSRC
jgi:hypothetical protein